ncbi:MAG: MptD family putative ECF transporter S component [Eubacteriales bacterium]
MNKLTAKDMITVGTFTTLLFVVKFVIGFIGMIPIFNVFLPPITAVAVAPIYLLFVKKVEKFGMITMMNVVLGVLCFLSGYGIYALVGSIIFGVIADVITKKGDYKDMKAIKLGYAFQAQWGVTMFVNMVLLGQAYYDELALSMGEEFAYELQKYLPWHCLLWIPILTFVAAYLGTFLCRNMMKRHFSGEVDNEL